MSKRWIFPVIMLALLGGVGAIAVWAFPFWWQLLYFLIFDPHEPWLQKPSPDGSLSVVTSYQGPAFHPFGPHSVRIAILSRDRLIGRYSTSLSNDGANLGKHNLEVRWLDNQTVELCLKGEEQKPEGLSVAIDARQTASFQPSADACDGAILNQITSPAIEFMTRLPRVEIETTFSTPLALR